MRDRSPLASASWRERARHHGWPSTNTRFFRGNPGETLTVTVAFNMAVLVDLETVFMAFQEQELRGWKDCDAFA